MELDARSHMRHGYAIVLRFLSLGLITLCCSAASVAGNDTLVTTNGDRLVGEIKKLERGVLYFDTDYADAVFTVEWKQVTLLRSDALLVTELVDGERVFGFFRPDPDHRDSVLLGMEGRERRASYGDVIQILTVEKGFWDRLTASFDLGYTLTKANNSQQLTTRGGVGYRAENWSLRGQFSVVRNTLSEAPQTRKVDASVDLRQRIYRRWFGFVGGAYARSDEQQLAGRYSANGGAGNYLIATPQMDLLLSLGLTWMAEEFVGPEVPSKRSIEGLLSAEYNAFDIGDLSLLSTLSAYPSLEDTDRVRGKFKLDLKWELPLDFTFKVGLTLDYDSKPPNEASKSDYVLSTTFGWEL